MAADRFPDFNEIAAEVKANHARLAACPRHDFGAPQAFQKRITCKNCGGWADSLAVVWYQRGLAHGAGVGGTDGR